MEEYITQRTKELGIKMSAREISETVMTMPLDEKGKFTRAMYRKWLKEKTQPEAERLALLSTLNEHQLDGPVETINRVLDPLGTMLYASLATIYAGEAGLNIVGCCFVGAIGGFGGGTLNNMMMGITPVFWMQEPHYIGLVVCGSILTFFCWPLLEEQRVAAEIVNMKPNPVTGLVEFEGFVRWYSKGGEFANRLKRRCERKLACKDGVSARQVFEWADLNGRGHLMQEDVRRFLRRAWIDSPLLYAVDSACLCTFAVLGTRRGINRGLHPIVCCAIGVSACFGGLLRDLITRRDVALGAEGFAFAMGAGATTYVGLRQLMLRGWPLPIGLRTALAAAAVLGVRYTEYHSPGPLFGTMFDYPRQLLPASADKGQSYEK